MRNAVDASPEKPILIDKFLERAVEIDVDALADESAVVICGIQEHIEEAGIHSGDSSSVLPAQKIHAEHLETIKHYTINLAKALKVVGLMNLAISHQRRPRLRHRSQSARVAHRAVSWQKRRAFRLRKLRL